MTLTDFLLSRIAEDEATVPGFALSRRDAAECEAKRRIVGRHDVVAVVGDCAFCGEPAPCEHLRFLALPYADHEDYREEWKP